MAVESIISPEHRGLPSVQRRHRHGEDGQTYHSVRKRSSKDWYPPEMAFVRSRLRMRRMIMDKKGRRTGHGDVLDTCHERGGNSGNIRVFKLAAEEVRAAICCFLVFMLHNSDSY